MTPTKKQISEVIEISAERGLNINAVLAMFKNCSISVYKAIGPSGFVTSFSKAQESLRANAKGGISFNLCKVEAVSEKAFLLSFNDPKGFKTIEKWVAKSVIINDVVPFWAIK